MAKQSKRLLKAVISAALVCLLITSASAVDYTSLQGYQATGVLSAETSKDYPWTVQTEDEGTLLSSGNSSCENTLSVLKITVMGSGALSYWYNVSSGNENSGLTPDPLLVSVNEEITEDTDWDDDTYAGKKYCGITDWRQDSILIEAATDQTQTVIYFAYAKDGSAGNDGGDDCAWLRDITFTQDTSVTLTAEYNSEYGTVTGAGTYQAGENATLTAEPKDGYQFYGWTDSAGAFLSDELTYTTKVNSDRTVKAIFARVGAYEARRGGKFCESLTAALSDAKPDSTVILLNDTALTQNTTIPAGVTLYIPYKDHDDGTVPHTNGGNAGDDLTGTPYRTLTVSSGVTLTVNGTLRLGSVIGKSDHYYQGHTSGAHGKVVNDGAIAVSSGGTLDSWGIISGSGTVNVTGGTVCEPFIVCDFSGGSNMEKLYFAKAAPFRRYATQNIQCTLTLNSARTLTGRGNLYAAGDYNEVDIPLVAKDGLFQLADGASITRTYDAGKQLTAYPGIGRESWTVTGGMTFGALKMMVWGFDISTEKCGFPLPYNLAMTLKNGDYTIPHHLRVMPGSTLTVGRGATLTVSGSLYALDGLKQGAMSGAYYPTTEQLKSGGFPANGQLVVDGGKLVIASGAAFGGVVQSTGSGSLSIEEGAVLTNDVRDGGKGCYSDNTAIFEDFTARAYIDGKLTALTAGEYHAIGSASFTLPSYTVKYVTNGETILIQGNTAATEELDYNKNGVKYATETVTIDQAMNGVWAAGEAPAATYSVTVVNKTYYRDNNDAETSVSYDPNGSTLTFTVQAGKSAYTHLARVQVGEREAVTVTPDANGIYTVTDVNDDVTITVISVKLGDVNLDSYVDSSDASKVLYYATGKETLDDLQLLAADVNHDGYRDSSDALQILYYATMKITEF